MTVRHLESQPVCPYLPVPETPMTAGAISRLGADRGPVFYETALNYAQSHWLQGYPAKALLLINRSLASDLPPDAGIFEEWPVPYEAAAWIMQSRKEEQFIGNPRRHYQHLATRMVEPRKEVRTWRAWACWRIACCVFPDYPADEKQIAEEGIVEPEPTEILAQIDALGWTGEVDRYQAAVRLVERA